MILPNVDQAIIPQAKLCDYLLSPIHPTGRFKARFFLALGYTRENWGQLAEDIRKLVERNEAILKEETEYGRKFEVQGMLKGANNRSAQVVSAWIILNGEDVPRFITAYPGD